MASTPVTKPEGHAESEASLLKQGLEQIVANDDSYALAA